MQEVKTQLEAMVSLSGKELKGPTKSAEPRSREKLLRARYLMTKLWPLMARAFGHKWSSQYGTEDTDDIWAKWLDGIEPYQIAAGMERLRDANPTWPPSAGEFRKLCLGQTEAAHGVGENGAGAYGRPHKALPKKVDREAAAKGIAAIRAGSMGTPIQDLGLAPAVAATAIDREQEKENGS